jgi:GNAT superfamily N-acetyltransferase
MGVDFRIAPVQAGDTDDLLPLMRGYCDFYESSPSDDGLRAMAGDLLDSPIRGLQLIARDADGRAAGFATLIWKWSALRAAIVGYLDDLFVAPEARGSGLADELIAECARRSRERGAPSMLWLTAEDNHRAHVVYDRSGAEFERMREYELMLGDQGEQ